MRRLFLERFIASYEKPPLEVVLDIDGWDDPTHSPQELSGNQSYYGHHMYFPVLINEASSGYPSILQLRAGQPKRAKGSREFYSEKERIVTILNKNGAKFQTNCGGAKNWQFLR